MKDGGPSRNMCVVSSVCVFNWDCQYTWGHSHQDVLTTVTSGSSRLAMGDDSNEYSGLMAITCLLPVRDGREVPASDSRS